MIIRSLIFYTLMMTLEVSGQTATYSLQTDRSVGADQLKEGFINPPGEARLRCYWWWLNSMATKESITRDLEEMKAKGYGGASIVDAGSSNYNVARKTPPGPVFMSSGWMELYRHAVREADRIGIELSVNVQSGWNPGAPSITPEYAMKRLVFSETEIAGGKKVSVELPEPASRLMYRDIMVQAVRKKEGAPVRNDAIKNWTLKTFTQSFGSKGIYPLHNLRDEFAGQGTGFALTTDEIIDITSGFRNGKLEWDAPDGDWVVIRYGYTCTGARTSTNSDGWSGLSVDHLSPEAFRIFSNTVIIPLIEAAKEAGNSVKFLQTDSWEMGTVSWTNNFPAEFRKFRGYDMEKYMPALAGWIVESREITNRFLHDFRKTIGDCVAEYHYRLFYELAHKHGMGIHPESGGPHSAPVDALKVMGISDFPQGEFWAVANTHRIKDAERLSVKQSACVAHTNGKRFVAAEGPTSIGPQWERSPKDLKGNIDRIFCSGVNRIVWHTFTSSPKEFGLPGNEYFAGTHLNPNVTWWEQSEDFIGYLNRCSFMLQQGVYVADVLYYYGDDVPNFVFLKEEYPELNFGYDWDKCSKDVILNRVSFDGEKIVLPDGMSYRVLVLAPEQAIDIDVLKKVESLVNSGMTVVSPRPGISSGLTGYPESDKELNAIIERMWGKIDGKNITENRFGKGRVIWGQDINKVLAGMNIDPDFSFRSSNDKTALDYIHRNTSSQDIYFVSNRFARKGIDDFEFRYLTDLPDRYEQVECSFRVKGKIPRLWDPVTGSITDILTYHEVNGRTIVPLHLEPEGSVFVVFSEAPSERHVTGIIKDGRQLFPGNQLNTLGNPYITIVKDGSRNAANIFEPGVYNLTWSDGSKETIKADKAAPGTKLPGPWEISFDRDLGGPEKIVADDLKSWTALGESVKYYSGAATYTKNFALKSKDLKNKLVLLDLGNVHEMASVKVNGHQMQVLWSAPFRFDITPYVKAGQNQIGIEVVNMWANRLIGDGKLPADKRLTRTNVNKFDQPDSEKYLRESGLTGPVEIRFAIKKNLK